VFASRAPELWRCAAGVASKEIWRSAVLEACGGFRDVEEA